MIYIEGGRGSLYQWDIDQRLIVEHDEVNEVHFANAASDLALVCVVYREGESRFADVPNILLRQPLTIRAFGCCEECVRVELAIPVIRRPKPTDYVYTQTEVAQLTELANRVKYLEETGDGPSGYYKPSVNAAGQLSWVPSVAGMPEVAPYAGWLTRNGGTMTGGLVLENGGVWVPIQFRRTIDGVLHELEISLDASKAYIVRRVGGEVVNALYLHNNSVTTVKPLANAAVAE